jgi:protein SCO1/2
VRAHLLPSCLLAALLIAGGAGANPDELLPIHDGVGGSFSAPSSLGREVSLSEYRGKVILLFFGYTSCQDVCPVTLSHLKALVKRLGPAADGIQVLFVTVDPENDTAEHLREYLARFDPRFVGITGTPDQVHHIVGLFRAKSNRSHDVHVSTEYQRSKPLTDQAYLYSHSQQIYLLDANGYTRGLYFSGSPLQEMEDSVRALLGEASGRGREGVTSGSEEGARPVHPPGHGNPQGTERAQK